MPCNCGQHGQCVRDRQAALARQHQGKPQELRPHQRHKHHGQTELQVAEGGEAEKGENSTRGCCCREMCQCITQVLRPIVITNASMCDPRPPPVSAALVKQSVNRATCLPDNPAFDVLLEVAIGDVKLTIIML